MVARIALSSNGRTGQYVGTLRDVPPGASAARFLDGVSDRVVGMRGSDLGAEFSLLLSFWRGDSTVLADDHTAARLFTQYCEGGTRVSVGINRSFISVTCTSTTGLSLTVESQITVLDTDRHLLTLRVTATQVIVYLEGLEVIKVDVALRAPDTSLCNIGADNDSRFFYGYVGDLAAYPVEPNHINEWLRYYAALVMGTDPRDYTPAPWSVGYHSTALLSEGFVAAGSSSSPTSRVRQGTAFRSEPELQPQFLEFSYTPGSGSVMFGVMTEAHNLALADLGATAYSYAYTETGELRHDGAVAVSGIDTWDSSNIMALSWTASTSTLGLWKDGVQIHSHVLGAGPWFAASSLGVRAVSVRSGQAFWRSLPPDTIGVYSTAWSRLATEFREMKLAEVAALLNDTDLTLRDAHSGAARGVYLDPPGAVVSGITTDSLDVARTVGAGIRVQAADWTAADAGFFFALAFAPTAADLVGEKVLLQSPGKWRLYLVDGVLHAEVGSVSVDSDTAAFEEDGHYLIGMLRGSTGRLVVWGPTGYLLQSEDPTVAQTAEDVWVAGASDGS